MVRNAEGALCPEPHAFENMVRKNCTMHDEDYAHRYLINTDMDNLIWTHTMRVWNRLPMSVQSSPHNIQTA